MWVILVWCLAETSLDDQSLSLCTTEHCLVYTHTDNMHLIWLGDVIEHKVYVLASYKSVVQRRV